MASSNRYAELHLHLEGSIDEEALLEIAPDLDPQAARQALRFEDFAGFLQSFKYAVMQLREVDHYRLLARKLFRRLSSQGIVYAEVIHSAGVCLWRGQDARGIAEALIDEGRKSDIEIRWIFDAVRQLGPAHVLEVAKFTAEFAGSPVLAFGVGGDESGCAAELLLPAFQLAARQGLKLVPHAGETSNAQNVRDALSLGADRIGHGIRASDDPLLMAELAARSIPLEICLTSNVLTGAVPSYAAHPIRKLFEAGVPITINTDDPGLFRTTLAQEFEHARILGFTALDLEQIRENGFRFAFDASSSL